MKFAQKLTVLMLLIILMVILPLFYFDHVLSINILEKQITEKLESDVFHTLDKIDMFLSERSADIKVIASDPVINTKSSTPQQITERLIYYRNQYNTYVSLSFFNLDRVRIADTAGLRIGKQHPITKYWEDALSGKISTASDVRFADDLNMPIIYFASPVKEKTGETFGVVIARVPFARVYDVIKKIGGVYWTRKDLSLDLIDKNNLLLYSSYNIKGMLKDTFSELEAIQRSRGGEKIGSGRCEHQNKEEGIYAFVSEQGHLDFKGNGWTLIAYIPVKVAFRPVFKLSAQRTLTLLPLIIFSVIVVLVFARTISQSIINLKQAAVEISRGNLDVKINVKSNGEIAELGASFSKMANDLKKSRNELKNWAATLERKVEERTRELTDAQEAALNILKDLTEAKRKLEKALEIKSEFTSTVSHELRTPLAAIKEGIAIVLDGTAGDVNAEQKEFLDIAKRNVDRLARLINDILDFQKLELGKMVFKITENNINELVTEVGKTMVSLSEKKGLELAIDLEDNLPAIKFDRDRITQVLDNILNNAIKFTEKGSVTIITRKKDNFIQVSVEDTGSGIRREDITKLFTRFEQLEKGIERKPGGAGLGLAISKEIVEMHKGKIWVESEFGRGSTFYFTLPVNM